MLSGGPSAAGFRPRPEVFGGHDEGRHPGHANPYVLVALAGAVLGQAHVAGAEVFLANLTTDLELELARRDDAELVHHVGVVIHRAVLPAQHAEARDRDWR